MTPQPQDRTRRTNTRWSPEENRAAEEAVKNGVRPCDARHLFPGRNKQFVWNIMQTWKKRVRNLCACNRPLPDDGFSKCAECREAAREKRAQAVAMGLCSQCRQNPADHTLTMCSECAAYHSQYNPVSSGNDRSYRGLLRWRGSGVVRNISYLCSQDDRGVVVDLFGGSADFTTLMRARGSRHVVYNDIHPLLCDLVQFVRDEPDAPHLLAEVSQDLTLRPIDEVVALYAEARAGQIDSPLLRAALLVVLAHNVRKRDLLRMEIPALRPLQKTYAERLRPLAARLRHVLVRNLDFAEAIRIYDSPRTLFFCDPPFLSANCPYEYDLTPARHEDLVAALRGIQGRFILTSSSSRAAVSTYRRLPHLWWMDTRVGTARYKQVVVSNFELPLERLLPERYGL